MHDFILCPYCGELIDDETECPTCGRNLLDVKLELTCPSCGMENPTENEMCYFCEYDLTDTKKRNWLWKNDTEIIAKNEQYKKISIAMFIALLLFFPFLFVTYLAHSYGWNILIASEIIAIICLITSIICGIIRSALGNKIDNLVERKIQNMRNQEKSFDD